MRKGKEGKKEKKGEKKKVNKNTLRSECATESELHQH